MGLTGVGVVLTNEDIEKFKQVIARIENVNLDLMARTFESRDAASKKLASLWTRIEKLRKDGQSIESSLSHSLSLVKTGEKVQVARQLGELVLSEEKARREVEDEKARVANYTITREDIRPVASDGLELLHTFFTQFTVSAQEKLRIMQVIVLMCTQPLKPGWLRKLKGIPRDQADQAISEMAKHVEARLREAQATNDASAERPARASARKRSPPK